MTKTLIMRFTLDNGKTYDMRIPSPTDGVQSTAVREAMNEIITKKALLVNEAYATGIKTAYTNTTENTTLS